MHQRYAGDVQLFWGLVLTVSPLAFGNIGCVTESATLVSGGRNSTGGAAPVGGCTNADCAGTSSTGGTSDGAAGMSTEQGGVAGMPSGGAATGGASNTGGATGGSNATGGTLAGGTGGAAAAGNGGNSNCPLPVAQIDSTGGAGGSSSITRSSMALTPPMGWNSWNAFTSSVSEALVEQIADAMVSSGMAAAGYQYVVIDDTWQGNRDACGNISANTSRFPSGIKALADYVHRNGLKLGLYSDRGVTTCSGYPGSYGYEERDAQTYASWGVDYLKHDNCNTLPATDANIGQADFTKMGNALLATGRPIVYSICAWWFSSWMPSVGNLWRTTTDIKDNFDTDYQGVVSLLNKNGEDTSRFGSFTTSTVTSAAYAAPGLSQYAGPGHWNDPDMLEVGNGGMTDTEYRTHFSMWAMMAAPLIAGNDLRIMNQPTKDILLNTDVIAVDQDALGKQGQPLSGSSLTLEVWSKQLTGPNTYAVVLFNRTAAAAEISVTWTELGITAASASVRDLWTHTDLGSISTQYTANVPSHGVVMLKVAGAG